MKKLRNDLLKEETIEYKIKQDGSLRNLTSIELISVVCGWGAKSETASSIVRSMLSVCDGKLSVLARKSIDELVQATGFSPKVCEKVLAALELGRRAQMEAAGDNPVCNHSNAIYEYLKSRIGNLDHEECHALLLNSRLKLIKSVCICKGGLSETSVDIRVVLKETLLANAVAIVLAHNHPSGNPRPSQQDYDLTCAIAEALGGVSVTLADHIIYTDTESYSFEENGLLGGAAKEEF